MELKGKYGSAIVYTDDIEEMATSQIINLLNQPMAENAHTRIMPDVHAGSGCVIGYTAKLTNKVVPNLIGVDIGCGVRAWRLGLRSVIGEKFDKLDKFIRNTIPSGKGNVHETTSFVVPDAVEEVCKRTGQKFDYVLQSVGTLGGGNHFIEVDCDDEDYLWLVIHSGSRNFGSKIAEYHQDVAEQAILGVSKEDFDKRVEEIKRTKKGKGIEAAIQVLRSESKRKGKASGLEYLEGSSLFAYLEDMRVAQYYAQLNREIMGHLILDGFYKLPIYELESIESVHNYINFQDQVVRKGAISAHEGEKVIIPLNMADGIIIGTGKGNEDWNYSAPHGAGRKMSRSKAKETIQLEDFQDVMKRKGVWTSTADKSTLDEAPAAYKKPEHIIKYLKDTVDIKVQMKPVYNFKSAE
jgi:RNA-splicing ligase RtcB